MNSIQQVVLGAACVGGAFLLGHYLNHSADSQDELLAAASGETKTEWQPSLLEPTERKAQLPSFRNSTNLDFDLDAVPTLPPPSQLGGPGETATRSDGADGTDGARKGRGTSQDQRSESGPNSQIVDNSDSRSKPVGPIEVPDFSELVNQFRGSPLELPPQTPDSTNLPAQVPNQELAEVRLTPIFSVPRFEESFTPPVDPDRLERGQGGGVSSQINAADFAPRLNETATYANQFDPSPTSVLEINAPIGLTAGAWQDDREERGNRVISYSDPFPPLGSESQPAQSQVSRESWQRAAEEANPGLSHQSLSPDQPIGSGVAGGSADQWNRRNAPPNPDLYRTESVNASQFGPGVQGSGPDLRYSKPVIEVQPATQGWQGRLEPVNRTNGGRQENPVRPNSADGPSGYPAGFEGQLSPLKRANAQRLELDASRFHNHPTEAGETLSSISTRYYGKPDFFLDIYLANQTIMRNPGDVRPGMVLKIPVYE
jgi:hypothetical protein